MGVRKGRIGGTVGNREGGLETVEGIVRQKQRRGLTERGVLRVW